MTALHQSIRTFIAAIAAFIFYYYFRWDQGYWIVLTAMLLVQIRLSDLFVKNELLLFCCGAAAIAHVELAGVFSVHHYWLAGYLLLTTFFSMYLGLSKSNVFIAAFSINLLGIAAGGLPVMGAAIESRSASVLVGAVIAIVVSTIFWPRSSRRAWHEYFADCLLAINQLQKTIFFIYLKRDYQEKYYVYEKELHHQRLEIFSIMQKNRELPITTYSVKIEHLNRLFEITMALGSLRYRIQDHTTFEMCAKEMTQCSQAISKILFSLIAKVNHKNVAIDISELMDGIQELEMVFRATLEVASGRPEAFLIFIQELRDISAELEWLDE